MILHLDIETRSSTDIKYGVYKYCEDPDFAILLFAYSIDGGDVQIIDLANGEEIPEAMIGCLKRYDIIKHAFNAQFERVCLNKHFQNIRESFRKNAPLVLRCEHPSDATTEIKGWHCTMAAASYHGIQGSLKNVAEYLGIESQKDAAGTRLINKFSNPPFQKPEGEDWERFKEYCKQDVRVEMAISDAVGRLPDAEQELYVLDQQINDRGVLIDLDLAKNAERMSREAQGAALAEIKKITGIDNPNSVHQLHGWLNTTTAPDFTSLDAEAIETALSGALPPDVRRVLELRQKASGSAVKKYKMMMAAACSDGRVRGLLQYYGARTGRWAGRLVQVQNLPRNHDPTLDLARGFVKDGDGEALDLIYDRPNILKQLIRTAIVPRPGCVFYTADFSAIEARIIAWLAGEKWVLDVFRGDGKIYEAAAARMLKKPISRITKDERQRGKVATLALGYQGWTGALVAMGALKMGIDEEELPGIAGAWREANPQIVKLWKQYARMAEDAFRGLGKQQDQKGCMFARHAGHLIITLPSGRYLVYRDFSVHGDGRLSYMGAGLGGKMERIETYGGKITENIVQAIARDLLAGAMKKLSEGCAIAFHVHDEIVIEAPEKWADDPAIQLESRILDAMVNNAPAWAAGLPLGCDIERLGFYKK